MSNILVVGSISTDFVVKTDRRPEIGETVEGENFQTSFGGKGANQAIACARLGAQTNMYGAVGQDEFGNRLLDNLTKNQVSTKHAVKINDQPSGSAFITVSDGDNSIIYIAGANQYYTPDKLFSTKDELENLKSGDIVLVQNETPEETIEKLISVCNEYQIPLVYNPAPARSIKTEWINKIAFLTPNEAEFQKLFPEKTIEDQLVKYPNKLIVTLGSKGAAFHNGEKVICVPAYEVDRVVDTTGAGDTFNGAFAVAYTAGESIENSIRFANKAASLSIQKPGAQNGMPTLKEMCHLSFN